jgi:hypothetical protein
MESAENGGWSQPGRVSSMHHNYADTDNDAKYEANINFASKFYGA